MLLYDRAFAPLVERLKPGLATVEHYICFDDEFDGWLAAEDGDYRWHEGDERDPCGLCYTSGTTGNPKGVLYEHRSTVLHAMSIIAPDVFDLSTQLGDASRGANVPRQQLVPALCRGDHRPEAGDLRGQPGGAHLPAPTPRRGDSLRRHADVWLNIIDHVEDTGAEPGQAQHHHRRRILRAASHDPLVPQARHPRPATFGA